VNRNVYLLAGAGGNISLSVGGDGVVMVNSGAAQASGKVLAEIQRLTQNVRQFTPPPVRNMASPAADTWQQDHAYAPVPIRTIINTNPDAEFTGGNEKIAGSSMFHPIGVEGVDHLAAEVIVSHERLQERMIAANAPTRALPTNTYFSARYRLHRFVNGEGVEVIHVPNAVTDGDSLVFFRGSDVISTGAVFNSDSYPEIDVNKGGSIQGEIDALIRIADMCFPEYMSQGGTLVIPGHGHISDVADVAYYRDMLIVIRDRVQSMMAKGMTLAQVRAAKPTLDYDPLFGRNPGATSRLVEAVYRSLAEPGKKEAAAK
jgi:cyclase